jgi:hypothetical protein
MGRVEEKMLGNTPYADYLVGGAIAFRDLYCGSACL